jgi:hypothetical protein
MNFDGSGRMTANQIADTWGERILAGSSQLMGGPHEGTPYREVFPSFLTRRYYGYYNWQTAEYEVVTRRGGRPARKRARAR